tara:strand:+ start:3380 stop:3796 length:417 start_codon:yes stop_codon:yes gene_type:complete
MYYNDDYFVKYYNDPEFTQPPLKYSKHAIQRQNEKNVNNTKEYPIQDKLEKYLYYNKIKFDKDLIGRVIGKKGNNLKTLIYKVKCLVYTSNFDYCIDRTIVNNKYCIYILANNKDILSIATNELNSNIENICNTNNKK